MPNLNPGANARPPSRAAAQQPITVTLVTSPSTVGTSQTNPVEQAPVGQGQTVNP